MPESVEGRSDDYDRRVALAGGHEGIIGGLVVGAERNRRVVKWLLVSLLLDLLISVVLGGLAVASWQQAETVKHESRVACIQSAKNSIVINQFLELLIANSKISTLLTPAEKKSRVAGYTKLITEIPDCYKPPQ